MDSKIIDKLKEYDDKIHEMNEYDHLHRISIEEEKCDLSDLAEYIHKNYNKMDDDEMRRLLVKSMTSAEVKRSIYNIEFKYYKPDEIKEITLDQYVDEAMQYLNKFLLTSIGHKMEDNMWTIHNNKSNKYKIKENQIIFENSSSSIIFNGSSIKDLQDILNNISPDIKVKFYSTFSKNIYWLIFKCTHTTMKTYDREIAL
jgi:hypothetical protein